MSSESTLKHTGAAFAPHLVLGIAETATAEEARAAYLEAVRQHPPDRESERFHALRRAMHAFCEPLQVAEEMLADRRDTPDLQAVIDEAKQRPPRLPVQVVLALGNMPEGDA